MNITNKPIIVDRVTIGCDSYMGSDKEAEILVLALQSYGFLLQASNFDAKTQRYSFEQFADLIEANYDTENPRNAEIVDTLRALHQRNS